MTKNEWFRVIWGILSVLLFSSGLVSRNVVTMIVGLVLALGSVSAYLISYVKSDRVVKRVLDVVFAIAVVGIVVYGYILTQSVTLGLMIIFMTIMILVAGTLRYLLPRIRGKS